MSPELTWQPGRALRLLVVDDDELDRAQVLRLLGKAHAHVEAVLVDSVSAALAYAPTHPFDCIVLDYMLPEGPCTETLPRLIRAFDGAAIVVLTGQGDEAVAVQIMKLGASDYLSKDKLEAGALWRSVQYACSLHAAQRATTLAAARSRSHALRLRAMVAATPKLGRAQSVAELVVLAAEVARDVLSVSTAFVSIDSSGGVCDKVATSFATPEPMLQRDRWLIARSLVGEGGPLARHVFDGGEDVMVIGLIDRAGINVGCIAVPCADDPLRTDSAESLLLALAQIVTVTRDNLELYLAATHAVQARDEVMAVVSHDLRAPLGNMVLGLSLLNEVVTGDGDRKTLARIERNVSHMGHLVDELVDMVRVEGKRLDVAMTSQGVAEILDTAMALVAPLAEVAGVRCTVERDPSATRVPADKHRIVQVLANLVGNALKFTPSGGRIHVSVVQRSEEVLFRVSDTGPGIAEDQIEEVFKRFWRSDAGAKKGLGLGLFIARGIVEAHGGHIWCESSPGEGASFLFTLPAPKAPEPLDSGIAKTRRTALVADDDDDIRALMSRALQRAGFEVSEFKNGHDLVVAFRELEQQASLVVSDIGMPELDGIAAVAQIRALSATQPILMVTAFTDQSTLRRAQSAGATQVLYKPLNLTSFVAAAIASVGVSS